MGANDTVDAAKSTTGASKRKPGRAPDEAWALFSKVENASNLKSLKCDHCGVGITTPKIQCVKDHLRKCNAIKRKYKKDDINTPDWVYSKSAKSAVGSIASSAGSNQPRITAHFNKKLSKSELDKFYYYLAMHFYLSGTSYSRIEEPFLLYNSETMSFKEKINEYKNEDILYTSVDHLPAEMPVEASRHFGSQLLPFIE